ncbi:extracellular exo-polygalacturonase [Colletotrichum truncatum]|uniref:Extracellular exo-polygalacturonase n=1 Tax=Colletotrichum truncatum TaxID=5467 RepID=A0ACC3ZF27_COLTU|nr:extracellular exo-polygalacturonase [Colletotrichum truncatum]KAF6801625.1 extracellular exo-polygalacturonase [Colletotrichum truncatum]
MVYLLPLILSCAISVAAGDALLPSHDRNPGGVFQRASCTPTTANSPSSDDVPSIVDAFKKCGNGGTITIPKGTTYIIGSVLNFEGCSNCDFQLEGTLKVSENFTYWNGKQSIINIKNINGAKIRSLSGAGVIDGNGQGSWDKFATDKTYDRPTLLYITGSSNIEVSGIAVKDPPSFGLSAAGGSTNVAFSDISLSAFSKSSNLPKNTDGFDIGPASQVRLQNITVNNDDDCVALKAGANFVEIRNITCSGSHGLSIGSLGKSAGSTDFVKNVYIGNAIMKKSTKAAGIKVYPGGSTHGVATVSNVTWDGVVVDQSDYAFQVQTCYGETAEFCTSNPPTAQITDITVKNFSGTTSPKYKGVTANINCPVKGSCNIKFVDWKVKPSSGTATVACANSSGVTGVTCSPGASG